MLRWFWFWSTTTFLLFHSVPDHVRLDYIVHHTQSSDTLILIVKATAWKTEAEVIKVKFLPLLYHFLWNRGGERKAAGGEAEIAGASFFRLFIRDHQLLQLLQNIKSNKGNKKIHNRRWLSCKTSADATCSWNSSSSWCLQSSCHLDSFRRERNKVLQQ